MCRYCETDEMDPEDVAEDVANEAMRTETIRVALRVVLPCLLSVVPMLAEVTLSVIGLFLLDNVWLLAGVVAFAAADVAWRAVQIKQARRKPKDGPLDLKIWRLAAARVVRSPWSILAGFALSHWMPLAVAVGVASLLWVAPIVTALAVARPLRRWEAMDRFVNSTDPKNTPEV